MNFPMSILLNEFSFIGLTMSTTMIFFLYLKRNVFICEGVLDSISYLFVIWHYYVKNIKSFIKIFDLQINNIKYNNLIMGKQF